MSGIFKKYTYKLKDQIIQQQTFQNLPLAGRGNNHDPALLKKDEKCSNLIYDMIQYVYI